MGVKQGCPLRLVLFGLCGNGVESTCLIHLILLHLCSWKSVRLQTSGQHQPAINLKIQVRVFQASSFLVLVLHGAVVSGELNKECKCL